ncbi:MAG: hypothetical protein A3H52_01880 [Candidatus Zambryskibacteria bacterium RIFCSPLOWO2_02_FULL_39_26]|uniref:Peptidase M16 n=1 Tax=Candidatus Zambryskibacteria bacterium RIFCSPLOWO2_12_FULL_39_23 TaxID=1802776 RepID=A0A1G2UR68_9BACT|nr:MAG: hypothetical protein A2W51_00225 [Candidatus Zambryskibacteria bacterium RIFCSPHIGHO2_02_39_10]OHB00225.1 MAG: hypothetical protein A3E59_01525 [Candidatus Zambryskibacteria bacterium RIFCSPHIGHO2_12_FULL_39_47]OHB10044.1 MAG: hypothetical protein A3H52_01880 [Candidatus Zambryskibacteria bacterium RIFCSPLOWO2_02_FULL_39_26]OHB11874.1 MAG: hypothetical protein A3G99_00940 [Candidatus Zambryskibacteria bacterium RIFCSPLOWO2_12_FULL_39_23]
MLFKKTVLKNGLTVITVPMKDNPSVTCLVTVKTGSKYETKDINGLSHFLEHMCFKGTTNRPRPIDIALELDNIGAQNNAFTGQEYTGYYAKAHLKHTDIILDVVSDMYNNPIFDSKEIEKERGVIIEEINMYEDMPHVKVYYVFLELLYGDQPAGWDILGPKENIARITQKDFLKYRAKHYVASATTVIVSGNIDESKIINQIKKLFHNISTDGKTDKIKVVENQIKPSIKLRHKETDQTHLIIGVRTFGAKDKRHIILKVLNSLLGGGMSSRMFRKLREQMGSCYYVNTDSDKFTDHGYLYISAGINIKRIEEVVTAILSELNKIKNEDISTEELQKAKDYLAGHIYLGLESSDSLGLYYAFQDILGEDIKNPDGLIKNIQEVTAKEIQDLAKEIFIDKGLNMAIVGNIKDLQSLGKIFHF